MSELTEDQAERLVVALEGISVGLKDLGTGDAATEGWGAIDALADAIQEGLEAVAASISDVIEYMAEYRSSATLIDFARRERER